MYILMECISMSEDNIVAMFLAIENCVNNKRFDYKYSQAMLHKYCFERIPWDVRFQYENLMDNFNKKIK